MKLPKTIYDYLNSQKLMAVSTVGEHPWIAWVYYAVDEDCNLYFISDSDSIHGKHLETNKKVACGIADTSQSATSKKVALQIYGEVSVVTGLNKLKWFFKMWAKINPGTENKLNFEIYQTGKLESNVYRVVPKKVRFFNQNLYDNAESDGLFE